MNRGEAPNVVQENHGLSPLNYLDAKKDGDVLKSNGTLLFGSTSNGEDLNIPIQDASITEPDDVNNDSEKLLPTSNLSEDDRITTAGDDLDGIEKLADSTNVAEAANQSSLVNIEADPKIWLPPEPEDQGDDVELSVANNDDDDDEYYGGTKWAQPSSLGISDEGIGINNNYKEERQKAMMEAMNGQFKTLVSRFLASEGIPLSTEEPGESWLDIISSISWEAAMLVRPDVNEGKAMDPGSYVKVKCIASGSPSQR